MAVGQSGLAELVTRRTGLDALHPTIARRLGEATAALAWLGGPAPTGVATLAAALADQPDGAPGWQGLLERLVVAETYLFRDPAQLALASAVALAPPLADRAAGRALRLWSVGCCTGEEAYTLAVLATQALSRAGLASPDGADLLGGWGVDVLGSDICGSLLERAAAGAYPVGVLSAFRATPADCLAFFPCAGPGFRGVRADIRARVRFLRAGLLTLPGPAMTGCDVVACRNVLVYLSEAARRHTLALLALAVRPGGVLLLGPADPPPGAGFTAVWTGDAVVYRREAGG